MLFRSTPQQHSCPEGHWCPTGSAIERICEAGTYQDAIEQGSCKNCPEGKYCGPASTNDGIDCPKGYYCPEKTGYYEYFPCDLGTYSGALNIKSQSECLSCPDGEYCYGYGKTSSGGKCDAGYYCTSGGEATSSKPTVSTQGGKCPAGFYCVEGSTEPTKCTAPYVCNEEAMKEVDTTRKCNHGFLCSDGLAYTNPEGLGVIGDFCPKGSWCRDGIATECLAGTYLPSIGAGARIDPAASGLNECLTCPYGFY